MWRWGYQFILQDNDTMWSHSNCSAICNRRLVSPTAKAVRGDFTLGKWSFSGEAGEFTSCSTQGSSLELGLQVLSHIHSMLVTEGQGGERSVGSGCHSGQWAELAPGAAIALSVPDPGEHLELASPGRNSGNSGTYWRRHVWRPLQIWNKVNDFPELSVQLHWVMKPMM